MNDSGATMHTALPAPPSMSCTPIQGPPSCRSTRGTLPAAALRGALAAVVLPALAVLATPGPVRAEGGGATVDGAGIYAGVFAGRGRADNRVVDVDGFSNWGNPGWTVDYDDAGTVVGVLVGRRFEIGGMPLRVELDGTFGGMSAKTSRIDPGNPDDPDETVESEFRWIATARAGVEQAVGRATVFASAGLALARIENSLTDLDRGLDRSFDPPRPTPWRMDPDDSFRDGSTEFGWVIGAGVETSLSDAWTLRLEGSYLDFGESTHRANRSGNNRCCGADTPRRPVSYRIENKLGIVRLALVHRFGGP